MKLCVYGVHPKTGAPCPPHPTQVAITDWVRQRVQTPSETGLPVLYVQHGVRAGGTRSILNPAMARLFKEPGLRALVARAYYNDLRKSVMETFFEILPESELLAKDEQEHRYEIRCRDPVTQADGRSTVYFTGLTDVSGLGSQEFGLILVHEAHELTYHVYRSLKPRASQRGYTPMILMEGNPPVSGAWLDQLCDPSALLYDPDVTRIVLPTYENWANLDAGFRESLERMDSAWRRRFLLGESGYVPSGQPVYPTFVSETHVRDTALIPDRPLLRGWDFGFRKAACLWAQLSDDGRLLVHREWMPLNLPEGAFIDGVKRRTVEWFGERVCKDYGDPAAAQRDPHGISTLRRLSEAGITLAFRQTTYGERIPLINEKLSELIAGQAAVIVDPRCHILIEALSGGYHFAELKEGQELVGKRDLPYKDGYFDHLADAFAYLMVNLFGGASVSVAEKQSARQQRWRRETQTVWRGF